MEYVAITLDASIFDRYHCKLNSGMLKALEQFKGAPLKLIISDVVLREVEGHIVRNIKNAKQSAKKAFRDFENVGVIDEEGKSEFNKMMEGMEEVSMAKKSIEDFVEHTGLEVISSSEFVGMDSVVDRYFNGRPPFSKGKKKSEFPDALALLSLEGWASDKGGKVLIVSADNDWFEYSEISDSFAFRKDLAEALSEVQPINNALKYCSKLEMWLTSGPFEGLIRAVYDLVASSVINLEFHPVADSQFYVEGEIYDIENHQVDFDELTNLVPVRASEDELTVKARFLLFSTAHAGFDFTVYDKVDDSNDYLGGTVESVEFDLDVDVIITISGDFMDENPDVKLEELSVVNYDPAINFGYVEPDWMK